MWPFWVIEIDGHELGRYGERHSTLNGESIQVLKTFFFKKAALTGLNNRIVIIYHLHGHS